MHAHIGKESAWLAANDLNIQSLVEEYAYDPRPYAERLAEARAKFVASNPNLMTKPLVSVK